MERIPALDGLRTLAIVMVVAYHVDQSAVPAGYWGVIVFFVLSGYLITRLLSADADRDGRIDFGYFYLKRAARMFPALILFSLVLVATSVDWSQVAPTLGYYANYARITGFDLGLLTHTWFLAVMGHFYLLWPLVIGVVPARHRLRVIGLLALAAVVWRVIAIEVMSPGWVYNATDTNAAALLAGAFLGVVRPGGWRLAGWSIPALLVLMLLPVFGENGAAFLWGDFVAIALAVMALQYAMTRPAWIEHPVILWLGRISYGLYLWHYVFVNMEIPLWAALPLSVASAAASWYLLEKPLRRWPKRVHGETAPTDQSQSASSPHRG